MLGEEHDEAVGDDYGRPVGGDVVQPVRIGQLRADAVGVGGLWQHLSPDGDDLGEVDVVPVDGGRRVDAEHPVVDAGAQIKHDCVRVEDDQPAH